MVVNWNGLQRLEDCLGSLRDQDYPHTEIVFVDNGSTDGSVAFVSAEYSDVRIIALQENQGFTGGNNVGIEAAEGDLIVLVNNDTKCLPGMISAFAKAMTDDVTIGAAQGKIRWMGDTDLLDTGIGSFFTSTGFLLHAGHLKPDPGHTTPQRIFAAKGACLCLRASALKKSGLFDSMFFAYFEDTDLCWRIRLAGYEVKFVPDAEILHAMGGTGESATFALTNFHSYKNRIRSLIKNLGARKLAYVVPVHLMLCTGLMIAYAASGRFEIAKGIARSLMWTAQNLRSTLRERRHVQGQVRTVSDETVFRGTLVSVDIGSYVRLWRQYNSRQ